jgi:hypothetical protein
LHWAKQSSAVVIPVGCESGVWLPDPVGAKPHMSLLWRFAPVGFAAVGATAGTDVQALSKTMRLVLDWGGTLAAGTEYRMQSTTLLTMPKTKDWQELLASHCAWQRAAVVMPVGWARGAWLPDPAGAAPHVSLVVSWIGEAETMAARKAEAAMMLMKEGILIESWRMCCLKKTKVDWWIGNL